MSRHFDDQEIGWNPDDEQELEGLGDADPPAAEEQGPPAEEEPGPPATEEPPPGRALVRTGNGTTYVQPSAAETQTVYETRRTEQPPAARAPAPAASQKKGAHADDSHTGLKITLGVVVSSAVGFGLGWLAGRRRRR